MALGKGSMPENGVVNNYARTRVSELNSLFTDINLLQQSIAEENAEKELEALKKVQKYKQKMLDEELRAQKKYEEKLFKLKLEYGKKWNKEKEDALRKEFDKEVDEIAKVYKARAEEEEKIAKKYKGTIGGLVGSFKLGSLTGGGEGVLQAIKGISTFLQKFDNQIEEIASYQNRINTRLTGSGRRWDGLFGIANRITAVTGASPYVRTSDVMKNVDAMVASGIAYNVEMRAFLQTVKENIATTFDATNGTLLQLIRIQKQDTTASRLGMEAALNAYLNSMFQTTEYLVDAATGVKSSIYEASALMSAQAGIAFEYQVQKWLGSLYSVGMSQQSVGNIAAALGQLGSGDFTSLAGSGMQNLLVMAASRAGLSYGDLLIKGLDESNTNKLLQSMVQYLASIASDNRVVQSAYAKVFGLSSSDIRAAVNLAPDAGAVSGSSLGYMGSMLMLTGMMSTMPTRMSMGGMLSTLWDNIQYSMAEGIAANPAMYAIYKAAGLLDELAGGIAIPSVGAFAAGTGVQVDLETTVADLMRVGALGGSLLSSIGKLTSSLAGNVNPAGMLAMLQIGNQLDNVTRGAVKTLVSGITTSASIYRGNQNSGDVYENAMGEAGRQTLEAEYRDKTIHPDQEEEEEDLKLKDLNVSIQSIYDLLDSVISMGALRVTNSYGNSGGYTT